MAREAVPRAMVPPIAGPACFGPEAAALGLIGAGLRPSSAAIYRRDVADFLRWWNENPARATAADVRACLAATCPTPASWDRRRAALVHFYREGISAGLWTGNPALAVPRMRRGSWRGRP